VFWFLGEIFKNLEGVWRFNREIKSQLASSPSGIVTGQATLIKTPQENPLQYFYSEEGKFRLGRDTGSELDVSRQYFYEYDQTKDSINVYFATNQSTPDKFFHTLNFEKEQKDADWRAAGEHLCEADHYNANYIFPLKGHNTFSIEFNVRGPQKDYVASTKFTKI